METNGFSEPDTSGKTSPQNSNPELTNDEFIIVGIGASAGGVEALEALFCKLPDDLDMAFIITQHLSPDFESLMPQILARKTKMPVHSIVHNQTVEPNQVYVLPSGKELIISDRKLETRDQAEARILNNPIDQFFCSLANDVGSNAVAIVLSGTGSDGAKGVAEVHKAGGLVVVQSEKSAKFNGMPRSAISSGIVDAIESIEDIPNVLSRFAELAKKDLSGSKHKQFADSIGGERRIHRLLHSRFGIDFDLYKTDMFARRVQRRMCLTGNTEIEQYLARLETNPQELKNLYSDLLIGVTEFFRDMDAFNEMRLRVLPALLDAAAHTGEFRIWVAPCATGEEAYSIAIMMDELLKSRDFNLDVKIFATDLNSECIEVASRGVYSEDRLKNVSAERLEQYFTPVEDGYLVSRTLRKMIVFASHNLLQDAPFTKLNLATCRNLLIYLKPEAKQKITSLLNFSLLDSGVMWLGPSESLGDESEGFRAINDRWRIFRKVAAIPFSRVGLIETAPPITPRKKVPENRGIPQAELLNVYDSLLTQFMPPGLLVDDDNQIVHVFGAATKFLQIKPGRPARDFTELLPPAFRVAAINGMKRVRIEGKPISYSGLLIDEENTGMTYEISVSSAQAALTTPKYLVTFKECDLSSTTTATDEVLDGNQANIERVQFLEEQLQSTRESLHDSILDLKSTNEEMQSTNQELIASNEELQSTNEELHSVNEELYTVNSEHQRKITELIEMTDDMENLLDSIQVDTIFLDSELKVRKFTLGIAKTFRLIPQDVGRHIDSFNHELLYDDIVGLVDNVLTEEEAIEEEVQDKLGNWFLMRLLPYSSRGKIDGVLLTLIDITKLKEAEQRLAELSEVVQSSEDAIFRITPDGIIRSWNRGSEEIFSHTAEFMIGKNISLLTLDEGSKETMAEALTTVIDGRKIDHFQMKAVRRNGDEVDVQMSVSPIYNNENTLTAASIVLRDFTKQKHAEEENLAAVAQRDQFLAMLSHELRNPIAAIMNSLAVMKNEGISDELDLSARDVIGRQSQQLSKLLDDLLDVSRITHDKISLDLKPIDIIELSHDVVECVEGRLSEKMQNLTLEMHDRPVYINGDATRIIQAQINLLVNAMKYTPDLGNIKYSISVDGDNAIIEVEDDGEGMAPELLKKVFEVFVQADQPLDRKAGGMGLGLPLVKMIANAHHGKIHAFSDGPGRGSKFSLIFPLLADQEKTDVQRVETNRNATEKSDGQKLMLVEDNDGAREMLATFLEVEGFSVAKACNGIEAITTYDESMPSICIVDIGLPDLNGFEVAKRIRSKKHQPSLLIALTGYGQEQDREQVLSAGFDLHVVKPIAPEDLIAIIAKHQGRILQG